jgi:glycosyl transferase family 25
VISAAYDLIAWQADPARAIQIDQCDRYGFDAPIQVQSAMLASARPPGRSPAQRIRRVTAQIRMGLRQLRRGFGAERVEILPATNPSTAR